MTRSDKLRLSTVLRPLLLGAVAFTLAGCAAQSTGYSDLDRASTDQDALPAETQPSDMVDPDTIRFVTTDGDWSIWIASGSEPDSVCLILFASANGSNTATTSCDTSAGGVRVDENAPGGNYLAIPDSATPPDDATALSENVYRIGTD
ncbi:hypothetical protein P0L94_16005 [Microbacter sp. GSS18]|nr:hypothetical protein P0L94_16005 [Microbacter sp. GSS18]